MEAPNGVRIIRLYISGAMEAPKEQKTRHLCNSGAMRAPKERQIHSLGRQPADGSAVSSGLIRRRWP